MNSGSSNPSRNAPPSGPLAPDARLDGALEHKPDLHVPSDFAALVAARAVAQPVRRRRPVNFGILLALVCAAFAGVALFVLAPHASPTVHSLSFDAELVLLCELALIGCWFPRLQSSR